MADLAQMRADFRKASPLLAVEGWSAEELEAVNAAIRTAVSACDEGLLGCWSGWLREKAQQAEREIRPVENAIRLCDMVITTQAERDEKARRAREWR